MDVRRVRLSDVSSTKTNRSIAQVHDGGMSYTIKCETLVQNLDKNYQKVRRPVPFTLPKWPAVKVRRVSPFQKPFKFHVGQRISVKYGFIFFSSLILMEHTHIKLHTQLHSWTMPTRYP